MMMQANHLETGEEAQTAQYTVFVVDDSEDDRLLALKTLQKSPYVYNAHTFENGDKLMAHLASEGFYAGSIVRRMPLLIMLDMNMPGASNGIDILRCLRANPMTKDIPVVMLTGDTSSEKMQEADSLKVNAYIPKPLRLSSLHAVIMAGKPAGASA